VLDEVGWIEMPQKRRVIQKENMILAHGRLFYDDSFCARGKRLKRSHDLGNRCYKKTRRGNGGARGQELYLARRTLVWINEKEGGSSPLDGKGKRGKRGPS